MDPVTVLGAFSAILAIATEFDHIYKRLRHCARKLKHARKDIRAICDEVETFSILLGMFHRTVTDVRLEDEGLSREIRSSKIAQCIERSGKAALQKLRDLLHEVEPLRTDKKHPVLKRWYARWKWSERKEAWTPIQISLIRIQGSADMLMTMIFCQDILHRLGSLQAGDRTALNEMHEQLSLFTSRTKKLIARCNRAVEESRRIQVQQGYVSQIDYEVVAMAFRLARSHIASHPELGAALEQHGVPPLTAGNPTTSTNSGSSGSPQSRSSVPRRPRDPPPVLVPSSGHAHVPGTLTSMYELPRTGEHMFVPRTSPAFVPGPGAYSSDSESSASEAQPPSPTPAGSWVSTALAGIPEPSIRPSNPRQSDANLSERPVIVDDGLGLREEYRRPRRGRS